MITSTTLIGVSSNISPLYDFNYNYYDEYSNIRTESGTDFFKPIIPQISISGLTHIGNTGLIWSVTSPFYSKKYNRGVSLSSTLYYEYRISKIWKVRFSTSLSSRAKESVSPCVDGVGRNFHCYYGTQPNHPYFIYSFNALGDLLYRKHRTISLDQIGVSWFASF